MPIKDAQDIFQMLLAPDVFKQALATDFEDNGRPFKVVFIDPKWSTQDVVGGLQKLSEILMKAGVEAYTVEDTQTLDNWQAFVNARDYYNGACALLVNQAALSDLIHSTKDKDKAYVLQIERRIDVFMRQNGQKKASQDEPLGNAASQPVPAIVKITPEKTQTTLLKPAKPFHALERYRKLIGEEHSASPQNSSGAQFGNQKTKPPNRK